MAWLGAQSLRTEGSELFIWEKDRSSRAMTLCLGGAWVNLGEDDLGIQLMSRVDDEAALPSLFRWFKNRALAAGLPADPDIDTFLWGVLLELHQTPALPRTLDAFMDIFNRHSTTFGSLAKAQKYARSEQLALMTPKLRGALEPYVTGPFKRLVNAPVERFHLGRLHTFEDGGLSKSTEAYEALFEVIGDRLKERRHGQPIRNHVDEAWRVYRNPTMVKYLADDIPSWRKDNVAGLLATQSISQTHGSALTELLIENCEYNFYYPNPMAIAPKIQPMYEGLNLSRTDCEIIASGTPKQDVYVVKLAEGTRQRGGSRLIHLRMSPLAQVVCGSSTRQDHELMDELLSRYGVEEFPFRFLDARGFKDEAKRVRQALARRSLDLPLEPMLAEVAD
jgi:type IV secretion system protein VirB4